jgi:cell division protein FtsB
MIKGEVVGCIPGAGGIARLLKSPLATVILVGGSLLLSEMALRREKKKDEDELEKIKAEIRRLKAEQE